MSNNPSNIIDLRFGCIYKTRNIITNKVYIGQTTFIKNVVNGDYKGSGNYLWNSINKHGWDKFETKIVCLCDSKDELNKMEQFCIQEFNSLYPNGYNLMSGGGQNGKHSRISKNKMSEALKGDKNPFYGKKHSEETRKKLSEIKKGKPSWNKGKLCSDSHKENSAKARKGILLSDSTKLKMSQIRKGVKKSEFVCPYCNKTGRGAHVMLRYHFDNCKFNN
jgi:group I intron endonuclease